MPLVNSEVQTDECELSFLIPNGSLSYCHIDKVNSYISDNSIKVKNIWMSRGIRKCLWLLCLVTAFGSLGIIYFGYFHCPDSVCALSPASKNRYIISKPGIDSFHLDNDRIGKPLADSDRPETGPTFDEVIGHDFQFNIEDHDVIVFLHIQKTGGTTFGKHLVRDLDLQRGCQCHRKVRKRCTCLRPGHHSNETWLFSRYSTGWMCGLHADWTELTSCVDETMDELEKQEIKRRYFYITFLRDPIYRFFSEFRHVRRGATWKTARLMCSGKPATKEEVPPCYPGETWENVTMKEFLSCEDNLAFNRQTRMLADLSLVGCYNKSLMAKEERDNAMLLSAKNNLKHMAFFGLTEEQEISQYMFEETFNLKFLSRFQQYDHTLASTTLQNIDEVTMEKIKEKNNLDLKLYEYARTLLMQRYETLSSHDPHFHEHFQEMGKIKFSWDEIENAS